jgi:uncharacterized membrane protein
MSEGGNPIAPVPAIASQQPKAETLEEVLKEKAPDVLDAIPPDQKARLARITYEKHEYSMRASPLPDPLELEAYNKIIPNGADRILKMAENQSAHRIKIESIAITSQQRQGTCGQVFALIISLSALGLGTYAAVNGQAAFGSLIGGTTLVSLVSAFLYAQSSQKRELSEKKSQVQLSQPPFQSDNPEKKGRKK